MNWHTQMCPVIKSSVYMVSQNVIFMKGNAKLLLSRWFFESGGSSVLVLTPLGWTFKFKGKAWLHDSII